MILNFTVVFIAISLPQKPELYRCTWFTLQEFTPILVTRYTKTGMPRLMMAWLL
jgi:hypothetical protein